MISEVTSSRKEIREIALEVKTNKDETIKLASFINKPSSSYTKMEDALGNLLNAEEKSGFLKTFPKNYNRKVILLSKLMK